MSLFPPMRITKEHTERSVVSLIRDLENNRIEIPPHQRDYCWTYPQENKFILSTLQGYPIPSILINASYNDNVKPTLEDGRQRLTALSKFRKDAFPCGKEKDPSERRFYSQLTERERERFDDERIIVITFYNATQEQRIEIFDWHQNGAPLTPGERYHAHQSTPLIQFVKETLMTPGSGLHDRASDIWGVRGDFPNVKSKDKRRKWLQSAVALIVGLTYGPKYMNKNYQTVIDNGFMTHPSLTNEKKNAVLEDIKRILDIYETVQHIRPVTGTTWTNKHWDIGNFTGYIIYSLSVLDREQFNLILRESDNSKSNYDDDGYSPNSLASEPDEWNRLKEGWVNYIVHIRKVVQENPKRTFTTILDSYHHSDLSKARNWTLDRWENGYKRIFHPEEIRHIQFDSAATSEEESESENDSDEC